MKVCKKCKINKDFIEFGRRIHRKNGSKDICKTCKKFYHDNLLKIRCINCLKLRKDLCFKTNYVICDKCLKKTKRIIKCRICLKNKDRINFISMVSRICKNCNNTKQLAYRNLPETKEKARIRANNRNKTDTVYKIKKNLRQRLYMILKHGTKVGSAVKDLGCSADDLKFWLGFWFDEGMTWENYGEWEIDHIIDLKYFNLTDRKQFLVACNYKNLQPLWKNDNIKKGTYVMSEKRLPTPEEQQELRKIMEDKGFKYENIQDELNIERTDEGFENFKKILLSMDNDK